MEHSQLSTGWEKGAVSSDSLSIAWARLTWQEERCVERYIPFILGQNVTTSLMCIASVAGIYITVACSYTVHVLAICVLGNAMMFLSLSGKEEVVGVGWMA